MATERLQKILARAGVASRRAAEGLITAGRVRVNGKVVSELGAKADPRRDRVEVDGQRVVAEGLLYVVLHKPRGVVSTMSDPEGRQSVKDYLAEVPARVHPVGRLDYATSGVLLATNDGDFTDGLLHPKREVPKTYVVKVSGVMQEEDVEKWKKGVRLEDGVTAPAHALLLRHEGDKTWLELTIREGKNQQIRRMGEATGFPVMRLARTSFAGITSEGLRPGAWRYLTTEELRELKKGYGVPKVIRAAEEHAAVAPRAWPEARSRSKSRSQSWSPVAASSDRPSPRFGGGSPGRRGYEVKEDWGGGAGRGRTPDARDAMPRGDLRGGRGGRSRTTGSGGGIGGHDDSASYRISRTRRR